MKYQLPNRFKLTKQETKEIEGKMNNTSKEIAKSFLIGLFFFITSPISIYNKIKKRKKKNA